MGIDLEAVVPSFVSMRNVVLRHWQFCAASAALGSPQLHKLKGYALSNSKWHWIKIDVENNIAKGGWHCKAGAWCVACCVSSFVWWCDASFVVKRAHWVTSKSSTIMFVESTGQNFEFTTSNCESWPRAKKFWPRTSNSKFVKNADSKFLDPVK